MDDQGAAVLVTRYAHLLHQLSTFATAVDPRFQPDDSFYHWQPASVHLEHGQFSGIVQKLRFTGLVQLAQADSSGTPHDFEVNLTHGTGLASFHHAISPTRMIGWQLQGTQFRLFVRMQDQGLHGRGASFKDARAHTAASDHAPWFDFSDAEDLLGPLLHPRKPDAKVFLHFDPDFVYQTRTLHRSVTTSQLAQVLAEYTRRAQSSALNQVGAEA